MQPRSPRSARIAGGLDQHMLAVRGGEPPRHQDDPLIVMDARGGAEGSEPAHVDAGWIEHSRIDAARHDCDPFGRNARSARSRARPRRKKCWRRCGPRASARWRRMTAASRTAGGASGMLVTSQTGRCAVAESALQAAPAPCAWMTSIRSSEISRSSFVALRRSLSGFIVSLTSGIHSPPAVCNFPASGPGSPATRARAPLCTSPIAVSTATRAAGSSRSEGTICRMVAFGERAGRRSWRARMGGEDGRPVSHGEARVAAVAATLLRSMRA